MNNPTLHGDSMRYLVRKLILLFCLLAPFLSINLNAKEILTEFQADGHKKYSSLEGLNLHLTNLQKMYPHLPTEGGDPFSF